MAESKVHLKLLIDTKNKRVLFAEGGKDFVDFIFHILAMPLATAIRLLGKQEMVGCLGKLYESVENLNDSYILQGKNKDIFLKPKAPNPITSVPIALLTDKPTQKIYYSCSPCNQAHRESFASGSFNGFASGIIASGGIVSGGGFNGNASGSYNGFKSNERRYSFSDDPNTPCSMCSKPMTRLLTYVAPPPKKGVSNEGGFVKGVGTYMVTDDLVVKPSSTISSISLLNKFNVQELASLQEKEVDMGMNEVCWLDSFFCDHKPTQKIYYSCSPCNQAHHESFASGSFNGFASGIITSGGIVSGGGFNGIASGGFNGKASGSYNGFNSNERRYSFSDDPNTPCSMCSKPMTRILIYVAPPPKKGVSNEGGFVKGVGTYMVTDDLVVKPSSTISSIALLSKFNVQELASLQEKEVDMGMNEALKLLKASLRSSNVLTTVFLNDNHDPTSVNIS